MATRISPPQNKTYYINPDYLTFVENSGYGPNLIQVSASSSCYISVYDPANGIGYSDADRNYQRWKVTAYNNKFPSNEKFHIYVRLERSGTSALVIYDTVLRGVKGGEITVSKDENGNDVYTEAESTQDNYWFIKIGEVGATDGTSIREITYDTGYLTSDEGRDASSLNEMWELDKYSTPWLIRAKQWLQSFTVKGFITLIGGLVFKDKNGVEKPVVDIKRTVDNDVDVPIDDNTIPTTAYVKNLSDDRYLKKYEPDETEHRIKFFDGVEAGRFVQGMIGGSGTRLDGNGYGEMNGLTLREFLEVPELRFNRVDVVSGELWNSIAFGLVESVDVEKKICRLKLEGRERSGLQRYDICRGIFADFGDGEQWEGTDECGFLHLYGFRTSYFTPTKIIEDGEGKFSFYYNLKEGTDVHPSASMKFAVYGNFIDKARQASAYSTRTYKRYLNNVDTWVIDPDKHIYAQYGNLDGLTVGGMEMKGYGSFQSNVYITGGLFEFTPQQKEELRGEDSYSAVLSDYEGVVSIDDEGNVIGGETEIMNVVSGGQNVTSGGRNVVTVGYRLNTQVHAMRGSTQLFYSLSVEKGSYVVALRPVGCTAMVLNGVVVVNSVTDPANCYVDIYVNCEGKASFTLTYHVTAVRDGKNPIVADIDNEMDSVACDSDGKVLFGLPVSCRVSMWAGTKQLALDRLEVSAPDGVEFTSEKDTGNISVTAIAESAERTLPLSITAYASYGGVQYHKRLTFTVNKIVAGENALLYKLLPSVTSVSVDDAGNMTVSTVSCKVLAMDGKKTETLSSLPEDLSMQFFKDKTAPSEYGYASEIKLDGGERTVTFELRAGETLVDVETIPVIQDGGSPVVIDLDNEMQSVACDEDGKVILGLPVSTGVKMYYGSKAISLSGLEVSVPAGVTAEKGDASVTVTGITEEAPENLRVGITGKAVYGEVEYTRTAYLVINKLKQGESAQVVELLPSVTAIKVNDRKEYSPKNVSCKVKVTTGKRGMTEPAALPSGYSMKYAVDGDTVPDSYGFGQNVPVTSVKTSVTFYLYYGSQLVDRETIPVVSDAAGFIMSTVFLRSNSEPDTPTGGSYSSPIPTSSPKWDDGIPAGEEILWASVCTFRSDGNYPADAKWSTPRQMTDTASFDVEFSSVENPSPPVGHPNTNTQWSDAANENTIWMATCTKTNGAWSTWQISRIKGETGKDGISTLSLQVSSNTVSRNSFGTYNPSKILVRALRGDAEETVHMSLFGVKPSDGSMVYLKSTQASRWEISVTGYSKADYSGLVFRAYASASTSPADAFMAEATVNFTGNGSSGPMPRNRGQYSSTAFYAYNENYRDFTWTTDGQVYMRDAMGDAYTENKEGLIDGVKEQGCISGISPGTNTVYWRQASRQSLMAIDTALIDGAYIGGFVIQDKKMMSQESGDPGLVLDGVNGEIIAKKGTFKGDLYGDTISFSELTSTGSTFYLPPINGRHGMFYMDNAVCISRLAVNKTFVASGNDTIVKITGPSDISESSSIMISNQETVLFYSMRDAYGEYKWIATVIPYWVYGSEPEDSMVDSGLSTTSQRPVQNKVITARINELEGKLGSKIVYGYPDDPQDGVLYII